MGYINVYKPQGQNLYINIGQPKGDKYSLTKKWALYHISNCDISIFVNLKVTPDISLQTKAKGDKDSTTKNIFKLILRK